MRLLPATAVGKAMVCTKVPVGVYSNRKVAAAEPLVVAAAASPMRTTTMLPGVNGAAEATAGAKPSVARQASSRVLKKCFI